MDWRVYVLAFVTALNSIAIIVLADWIGKLLHILQEVDDLE